jgi:hypothetical protein
MQVVLYPVLQLLEQDVAFALAAVGTLWRILWT